MKNIKIALACFMGGALCCSVSLYLLPKFLWVGLIVGLVVGFISYEFHMYYRKVVSGIKSIIKNSFFLEVAGIMVRIIILNPFSITLILLSIVICLLIPYNLLFINFTDAELNMLSGVISILCSATIVIGLFFIGEKYGKISLYYPMVPNERIEAEKERKKNKGTYVIEPCTYINWYGVLFIGLKSLPKFIGEYISLFIMLIYSRKSILCGINGAIGGCISYLWFNSVTSTMGEQIMVTVLGGLFGSVLGVLNWEIISRRLLRLDIK